MTPDQSSTEASSGSSDLEHRYLDLLSRIKACCERNSRDPDSVQLVAVGKKQPVESIEAVSEFGQLDFAENYLQEACGKIDWLRTRCGRSKDNLVWHFIGHIQSRKCREIAEHFHWVHTVDSLKVASRLNSHVKGERLNVLIQVNIDKEETKSGVSIEELPELAFQVNALPGLHLRGLMIIPRVRHSIPEQRETFSRCRALQNSLNQDGFSLDQLSMGMTDDMEAAIAEGATMIRIGTALFGPRPSH